LAIFVLHKGENLKGQSPSGPVGKSPADISETRG
jgi:hypothetical protein